MPRWKQVFNCTTCGRRRWREVETDTFDDPPSVDKLRRGARCTACGGRDVDVRQYDAGPRVGDQTLPGGMTWGLAGFGDCVRRDQERREAMAEYLIRNGHPFVHPTDPEFGGPPAQR